MGGQGLADCDLFLYFPGGKINVYIFKELFKKKECDRELSVCLWLKVFSVWPFAEEIC